MALEAAADSVEQMKKGNAKEFPVDSDLVDRLVKNILRRSEDHSLSSKPARMTGRTGKRGASPHKHGPFGRDVDAERPSTYFAMKDLKEELGIGMTAPRTKACQIRQGDYDGFHRMLEETRTDRMLDAYDSYSSVWTVNLKN